ncbi:hypothetical protein [Streptomyces sp. Amel2xB2]|uniref:hypothetical protein n=1 Tax=Streptomyces sp. Amel2xB2 TaxID=1305829 RepID=UPI0015EB9626|nr:hypothetical protein [Streptomyces sp. Amel2xB2]
MILTIVLVGYFMIVLDNSVVFTGLPQIKAGMDLSAGGLPRTQNAYTPVFGGLLLLGARRRPARPSPGRSSTPYASLRLGRSHHLDRGHGRLRLRRRQRR